MAVITKINKNVELVEYDGKETDTAKVNVDGKSLGVDVKKAPGTLKIVHSDTVVSYNGSSDATFNIDEELAKGSDLTKEISDREAGDRDLNAKFTSLLSQETQSRVDGDSKLKASIDKEIADRKYQYESFQGEISDEATDRKSQDEALDKRLTAAELRLKDEATTRQTKDDSINARIVKEIADRGAADKETLTSANEYSDGKLSNEKTAREASEKEIKELISTESETRQSADEALQKSLDNECGRAKNEEKNLSNRIKPFENGLEVVEDTVKAKWTDSGEDASSVLATHAYIDNFIKPNWEAIGTASIERDDALQTGIDEINEELGDYYTKSQIDDQHQTMKTEIASTYAKQSESTKYFRDGWGSSSVNQVQDGTSGTFDFTGKNPNATSIDSSLTGDITYGAVGAYSASFGGKSSAQGKRSFACGTTTIAKGDYSFASGDNSVALGNDSHVEGYSTTTNGTASHAEGYNTLSIGHSAHAEGNNTKSSGDYSHSEGLRSEASGEISHAEGADTKAAAYNSHVEGNSTETRTSLPTSGDGSSGGSSDNPDDTSWKINEHRGVSSHAEGVGSVSYGYAAHAEGFKSVAFGHISHAEGEKTRTGGKDTTYGRGAHAEGFNTTAKGDYSHAEGSGTTASAAYSHAGGFNSEASDYGAFAHGNRAKATGYYSVAFGDYTQATRKSQFVCGERNETDKDALFIVGNGSDTESKNAFTVLKDGRAQVQTAPIENNDVVRKSDLPHLYRHDLEILSYKDYDADNACGFFVTGYSTKSAVEITNDLTLSPLSLSQDDSVKLFICLFGETSENLYTTPIIGKFALRGSYDSTLGAAVSVDKVGIGNGKLYFSSRADATSFKCAVISALPLYSATTKTGYTFLCDNWYCTKIF